VTRRSRRRASPGGLARPQSFQAREAPPGHAGRRRGDLVSGL